MNYKKVLITSFIFSLCFSLMPITKATEERFEPITLQQIVNAIDDDDIITDAEFAEMKPNRPKDDISITKQIEGNVLKITAISKTGFKYNHNEGLKEEESFEIILDEHKLDASFTLDKNILSSNKIDYKYTANGEWKTLERFRTNVICSVYSKILKLMGYDEEMLEYQGIIVMMGTSTLAKEGMQKIEEENGRYATYQIDLGKKANVFDMKYLESAIQMFNNKCNKGNTNTPKELVGLSSNMDVAKPYLVNIYQKNIEPVEEITVLKQENFIISSGNLSDTEKLKQDATLYFFDCLAQIVYGYSEFDLMNTIKNDASKDYKLADQGFEKVKIENGTYQYKMNLSKKVPLIKQTQNSQTKPNDKKENNEISNHIKGNEVIDNTTAKEKLPQTNFELTGIIIAIIIVLMIMVISIIKRYKTKLK